MASPLKDDREGKQKLASRLYRDFHAMKTYGKEPESLESIISLFNETMADFPIDQILKAMHEHAKASPEFPTPAEIISRINEAARTEASAMISLERDISRRPEYVETLKRYRSIGIPLTPSQQRILAETEKS